MDDPFKWLSAWAALLSTGLGFLQFTKWWRTRVIVKASIREVHQFDVFKPGSVKQVGGSYLFVEVVNHLDHAISVTTLSFIPNRSKALRGALLNVNDTTAGIVWRLPVTIAAHAAQSFPIPSWNEVRKASYFAGGSARIEITVATGESYLSRKIKPSEGDGPSPSTPTALPP